MPSIARRGTSGPGGQDGIVVDLTLQGDGLYHWLVFFVLGGGGTAHPRRRERMTPIDLLQLYHQCLYCPRTCRRVANSIPNAGEVTFFFYR